MEVEITQDTLSKALQATSRVAAARASLPVLGNVLLRTSGTNLLVAATNLELAATTNVGAKVITQGEVTVPAKLISEFIGNLPKEKIELKVKNHKLQIHCAGYTSTINGIDAEEFPELPTIDEKTSVHFTMSRDDFKQAVTQTSLACSNDVTRPVLTGLFWHTFEDSLYIVGTDGYRLAERKLFDTKSDLAAIVPVTTIQEVQRVLSDTVEEIDVLFDESQVRFRVGDTEITSRLIDGKYPDYRKLIPQTSEINFTVDSDELARTAKIARLFSHDSGGSITMSVDGEANTLSINSVASDIGDNTAVLDVTASGSGSVSLNSRYLSEVLAVIDAERLSIGFSGKLAPVVVRADAEPTDYTHIIMPLKS